MSQSSKKGNFMTRLLKAIFYFSTFLVLYSLLSGCDRNEGTASSQNNKVISIRVDDIPLSGKEPMLMIDDHLEPFAKPKYQLISRDLYECNGMVAPWLEKLLIAELNFLAEKSKLQLMDKPICLLNVDKKESPKNGRFSVHFYKNQDDLNECVFHQNCSIARNATLVLKNQLVFRSYFLSDFKREKYYQHCVTPDGNWIANTTCYTVGN
jgi:hypothetical protein